MPLPTIIAGSAYVLGDDIDTDQIIPAMHLVYSLTEPDERKLYGRFAFSGVPDGAQGLPSGDIRFTRTDAFKSEYSIIVAGRNFGCGSSREHAPFAIREAGCRTVIAESYARIFYRNAIDGGFLTPLESPVRLIDHIQTGDRLKVDLKTSIVTRVDFGEEFSLSPLGEVARILDAGDLFAYARQTGLL